MIDNDKKTAKFIEAITAYAQQQSQHIHREVEAYKAERLAKAERQVMAESARLIRGERENAGNRLRQELAGREADRRAGLIRERQKRMDEVFADARRELLAYTATPAYADWLAASLREMAAALPGEGTVFYLCERDKERIPALQALCPAGCRFEVAGDIAIGGIRGIQPAAGLLADDTLDTRLEEQRDWLMESMGLTIQPV
ncbi:MAG: V-type ATP synthase subunit E [Acutalibacteraceae bacterium]|jgi:vacuolar-type H+-ATPase subunit E/Vma4